MCVVLNCHTVAIATQLTNYISNTLTPQIKGKSGAMFPFAPGQHHNVVQEGGLLFL